MSYPGCRLDLRKEAQASPGDHRNKPESLRHCVGVSEACLKRKGGALLKCKTQGHLSGNEPGVGGVEGNPPTKTKAGMGGSPDPSSF